MVWNSPYIWTYRPVVVVGVVWWLCINSAKAIPHTYCPPKNTLYFACVFDAPMINDYTRVGTQAWHMGGFGENHKSSQHQHDIHTYIYKCVYLLYVVCGGVEFRQVLLLWITYIQLSKWVIMLWQIFLQNVLKTKKYIE